MEDDDRALLDALTQSAPRTTSKLLSRKSIATTDRKRPDTAKRARFAEDDEDEDDIEEFESMGAETPASVRNLKRHLFTEEVADKPQATTAPAVKAPLFDRAREPVQVYLRIRPFLTEQERESSGCVVPLSEQVVALRVPSKTQTLKIGERDMESRYVFSEVFEMGASQQEVFEKTALGLVRALFEGKNGLMFAHGITNSGKTYTIQGTPEEPGVLCRSLDVIFNSIHAAGMLDTRAEAPVLQPLPKDALTVPVDISAGYTVHVSFMEIYNEQIFDLLVDPPPEIEPGALHPNPVPPKRKVLKMKEDQHGRVFVQDLLREEVTSTQAALDVVEQGLRNRQIANNNIHSASSRSHSVFTITLTKTSHMSGKKEVSRLAIVDLAGSERSKKTMNKGQRMRETCNINSSLMVLQRCMQALRWNQQHPFQQQKLVPFRDSKLTRLFNDSLSDGRAVMVANVNASAAYYEETYHSLQFASIARQVTTLASRDASNTPARFNSYAQRATSTLSTTADRTTAQTPSTAMDSAEKQELLLRIQELEDALVEAQGNYASLEQDIRAEVSAEMEQMLQEQQNQLQQERQDMEDQFEKRLISLSRGGTLDREIAQHMDNIERKYGTKMAISTARIQELETELKEQEAEFDEEVTELQEQIQELQNKNQALEKQVMTLQEENLKTVEEHGQQLAGITQQYEEACLRAYTAQQELERATQAHKTAQQQADAKLTEIMAEHERVLAAQVTSADEKVAYLTQQLRGEQAESQRAAAAAADLKRKLEILEAQRVAGTAVLHSRASPDTKSVRTHVLPQGSKVVATPSKKELLKSNKTPRFSRYEIMDVSPDKSGDGARVTLWKGELQRSASGKGVSMRFTDVETLNQQPVDTAFSKRASDAGSPESASKRHKAATTVIFTDAATDPVEEMASEPAQTVPEATPEQPCLETPSEMPVETSVTEAVDAPAVEADTVPTTSTPVAVPTLVVESVVADEKPSRKRRSADAAAKPLRKSTAARKSARGKRVKEVQEQPEDDLYAVPTPPQAVRKSSANPKATEAEAEPQEVEKENTPNKAQAVTTPSAAATKGPRRRKLFTVKKVETSADSPSVDQPLPKATPIARRTRSRGGKNLTDLLPTFFMKKIIK